MSRGARKLPVRLPCIPPGTWSGLPTLLEPISPSEFWGVLQAPLSTSERFDRTWSTNPVTQNPASVKRSSLVSDLARQRVLHTRRCAKRRCTRQYHSSGRTGMQFGSPRRHEERRRVAAFLFQGQAAPRPPGSTSREPHGRFPFGRPLPVWPGSRPSVLGEQQSDAPWPGMATTRRCSRPYK